jgi:hypothetical protein
LSHTPLKRTWKSQGLLAQVANEIVSACPGPNDNESFDQQFIVTIGGLPFNLSTVVHVSRGRSSGNWFVDVNHHDSIGSKINKWKAV